MFIVTETGAYELGTILQRLGVPPLVLSVPPLNPSL